MRRSCNRFEIAMPQGILDTGMKYDIGRGADNRVDAPTRQALGVDIDEDDIGRHTLREP